MTATRIYAVTNKETGFEHLVRAANQAQAIRHAARNQFAVEVATQDQLVELIAAGVKVEEAVTEADVVGQEAQSAAN